MIKFIKNSIWFICWVIFIISVAIGQCLLVAVTQHQMYRGTEIDKTQIDFIVFGMFVFLLVLDLIFIKRIEIK